MHSPPTTPAPQRRNRTDAARNRERLLDAARAVYAEHGTSTSLKVIADRAGLGVGTVYRHFPTTDALVAAVLAERYDDLAGRASAAIGLADPDRALADWLEQFITHLTEYRGLAARALPQMHDPDSPLRDACERMRTAAGELLAEAQHAGLVRKDVDTSTMLNLANAVAIAVAERPEHRAVATSVFVTGLQT